MTERMEISRKQAPVKRNLWLIIIVCILGTMFTGLWLITTPESLLGKVDAVGYAVCHRIPSHSLSLAGRPMPLCARCSGMYLGAMFGMVYQMMIGKRRGGFSRIALLILSFIGLFFIIDGFNSFLGLVLDQSPIYEPHNWLRLVTGMGVGLLISSVLYPIFTQSAWKTWNHEAVLDNYKVLVGLLSGGALLVAALLTGYQEIQYMLAIISGLSVLGVLSLIYSVLLLMLFKHENRYNHFTELIPALLGGFGLTMMQIGLFDLMRFLLTGTWNGLLL